MDVGVDIVEIHRIAKQIKNPRFLTRVYSAQEVTYCRARKNSAQHFAVRFAAKEAVWKAIAGASKQGALSLLHRDIQVKNETSGKPHVVLPGRFSNLAKRVRISLSHGEDYAVAVAIVQ